MSDRLIIFARNFTVGKVKTRIAAKLGEDLAMEVYKILFSETIRIVAELPSHIEPVIYYSDYVELENKEELESCRTEVQEGPDLGERMANALKKEFQSGASKVCIIGTDIYNLKAQIIIDAFDLINDNTVVIGPAMDGGYYLLGTNRHNTELFSEIGWSKSTVLQETIKKVKDLDLEYILLEYLNDVDEYEDIPKEIREKLNLD